MKKLTKLKVKKTVLIVVTLSTLSLGCHVLFNMNLLKENTRSDYAYVLKEFAKKNRLILPKSVTVTQAEKYFSNTDIKKWPVWLQAITTFFIGRDLYLQIPIETKFILDLSTLTSDDIIIQNNTLMFKKRITVKVSSQQFGSIKVIRSNRRFIDKFVDVGLSGSKVQKFFSNESLNIIHSTSDRLKDNKQIRKKVAKDISEYLEKIINMSSKENLKIELEEEDLIFIIST